MMTPAVGKDAGIGKGGSDTGPALRYRHMYDLVVGLIQDQRLHDGDRIPSTPELARLGQVSIITVRRALDDLEREGRIIRRQGLGTFVASPRLVSEPSHPGPLLSTLRTSQAEIKLDTRLIGLAVGMPTAAQATSLNIDRGQPVWEVTRVRLLDEEPKVLERAILPLSLVPSLDKDLLAAGGSLYTFLSEQYDLTDESVEQAIEVDDPDKWERQNLAVTSHDTVVRIRGVSSLTSGAAFDAFQQTYRARDFTFYVSGHSTPRLFEPTSDTSWAVRQLPST